MCNIIFRTVTLSDKVLNLLDVLTRIVVLLLLKENAVILQAVLSKKWLNLNFQHLFEYCITSFRLKLFTKSMRLIV